MREYITVDALADEAGALPWLRRRALHVGVDDGLTDLRVVEVEEEEEEEEDRAEARGS